MDEREQLKQRNLIKGTGAAFVILAAVLIDDPNSLLIEGPGLATGACLLITLACIARLVLRSD